MAGRPVHRSHVLGEADRQLAGGVQAVVGNALLAAGLVDQDPRAIVDGVTGFVPLVVRRAGHALRQAAHPTATGMRVRWRAGIVTRDRSPVRWWGAAAVTVTSA